MPAVITGDILDYIPDDLVVVGIESRLVGVQHALDVGLVYDDLGSVDAIGSIDVAIDAYEFAIVCLLIQRLSKVNHTPM